MSAASVAGERADPPAAPAAPRRGARTTDLTAGAVVGLAAGLTFLTVRGALVDDAYITAAYARSVAFDGVWGIEPDLVSNTATSPLNVLLLAAATVVTRAPVVAIAVVLVAAAVLLGTSASAVARRVGGSPAVLTAGALLLVSSPLLASTIGLETVLAVALIALLGRVAVAGSPAGVGAVVGLLALTRADLVVLGLPALVWALRTQRLAPLGALALVSGPWYLGSWFLLGSAVPDTSLLKIGDSWDSWSFGNGLLLYLERYPAATLLSLAPLLALAAVPALLARPAGLPHRRRALVVAWGGGAVAYVALYLVLHPAPYHWYYGPALGALVLLGAAGLACAPRPPRRAGLAGFAVVLAVTAAFVAQRDRSTAPITTNWATADEYAAAAALAPPGSTVRSPGEIGTLAYFCACTVVDEFSDRGLLQQRLDRVRAESSPLRRWVLDLNYLHLERSAPRPPQLAFDYEDGPGPGLPAATPWRSGRLTLEPVGAVSPPS